MIDSVIYLIVIMAMGFGVFSLLCLVADWMDKIQAKRERRNRRG